MLRLGPFFLKAKLDRSLSLGGGWVFVGVLGGASMNLALR